MENIICGYCLDKEATTKRVFDICNFYGIENKDLKKLFGVSDSIVSYWRNGTRFFDWDKLMMFAYVLKLPLDVIIITKKRSLNEQMNQAIIKIKKLQEKKYISKLQDILDSGKLDNQPEYFEIIINPLEEDNDDFIVDAIQYKKLITDIKFYGLKKRTKRTNADD